MTDTLVTTPDTRETGVAEACATSGKEPMRIVLGPGVVDLVRGQGEEAISLELTLEFQGLVVKHAVAYPGASEPAFGYSRLGAGGIDVWWRQRLVVPGRESALTTAIRPRHVAIDRVGRALSAVAAYA